MPRLNKKLRLQSSINSLEYPRVHEFLHEVAGEERGMRARLLLSLGMLVLDNQISLTSQSAAAPSAPPAVQPTPAARKSGDLSSRLESLGVTGSLRFDTTSLSK
ncbi:MAG: hypothetical protein OEL20_05365 [Sulfuritalea sp.]|nr:hypothetical protein [Sulfuritalea sp.]